MSDLETKQLQVLHEISENISVMRQRTGNPRRSFLLGIFQGVGVVLGGILAVALSGAILALLGLIPGFSSFETYLNSAVQTYEHR
jgi:hypothetical protein